jgi:hypothetical protein
MAMGRSWDAASPSELRGEPDDDFPPGSASDAEPVRLLCGECRAVLIDPPGATESEVALFDLCDACEARRAALEEEWWAAAVLRATDRRNAGTDNDEIPW